MREREGERETKKKKRRRRIEEEEKKKKKKKMMKKEIEIINAFTFRFKSDIRCLTLERRHSKYNTYRARRKIIVRSHSHIITARLC